MSAAFFLYYLMRTRLTVSESIEAKKKMMKMIKKKKRISSFDVAAPADWHYYYDYYCT